MTRELKFGRKAALSYPKSIVVLVHGYGADGNDLLGLADPLSQHMPNTVFYAPDAPDPCAGNPFGRQWFGIPRFDGSSEADAAFGMQRAADDLNAFLDICLRSDAVAPNNLILLGFSQGAMMSLHIAPRREKPIAGVVAISGKLINPNALAADTKVKPDVLLVHGDQDPVVPFAEMGLAANALVSNGFATFTHVMKGTGHGIAPDGLGVALAFMTKRLAG